MDMLTDPFLIPSNRFDGPVLVPGAGGCIGSWALAILHRSGVPVVAADLSGGATVSEPAARGAAFQATDTLPPPPGCSRA